MLALVLQGGGARGAHQAGVIKALLESGYRFNAVCGTSIGALNGCMLAQGEFNRCLDLWQNVDVSKIFDFNDAEAQKLARGEAGWGTYAYLALKGAGSLLSGGLDTAKIRALIEEYVDEQKLRASSVDFGFMTYNLTKMQPNPYWKETVPQGKLTDYIMASANFPLFKGLKIDDTKYTDGGVYANLPLDMAIKRGYNDIIAVTTKPVKQREFEPGINVKYIQPVEKPSIMLNFTGESARNSLKIGYLDGIKAITGLKGGRLYIRGLDFEALEAEILRLPQDFWIDTAALLGIKLYQSRAINLVSFATALAALLKIKAYQSAGEVFLALVEKVALSIKEQGGFDNLRLLTFNQLVAEVYGKTRCAENPAKELNCFLVFARYWQA